MKIIFLTFCKIKTIACCIFFMLISSYIFAQSTDVKVTKIWDKGLHNAFTDLIRFNGRFYCAFREGSSHAPSIKHAPNSMEQKNGTVRVLVSKDGNLWDTLPLVQLDGYDLRDTKLSVTPSGKLMLLMGGSVYENGRLLRLKNHVSFYNKTTKSFSGPQPITIDDKINPDWNWLWNLTWDKGVGYGAVYQKRPDQKGNQLYLVKTNNGIDYSYVSALAVDQYVSESSIVIMPDKEIFVLARRDSVNNGFYTISSFLGKSKPPYKDWDWKKTGLQLGGPEFIQDGNGKFLIGTRSFREGKSHTSLVSMDTSGNFKNIIEFPSGGDTGYPGMVIYKDSLWFSYYSSHEGKSNIYFTRIPIRSIQPVNAN